MAVTTLPQEYTRLRSYLTPYIKGVNTDNILNALAGMSEYLINNAAGVNDQLYIASASGTYLDERLAQYGITRPPSLGLSDSVFSQIGIAVKNRKQVRDLMNKILDLMFGDEFVRAYSASTNYEPYNLTDGDNLIINFDNNPLNSNIVFSTEDFENIAAATAQEVADAITETLRTSGLTGTAIAKNDGNGNYVELLSDTIGPASSVTVFGGSAQNALLYASVIPAGGNLSTQWTLSLQPGGYVKFVWSGGANPNLGKVSVGNYVNIFGGGFSASTNTGSYPVTAVAGGVVGSSYFEVQNIFGSSGIITQGADNAVLFYSPEKRILSSNLLYAAVYQVMPNIVQIFMPASTLITGRTRMGAAHIHYPPTGTFTLNANPSLGEVFSITTSTSLVAGIDFAIGATAAITTQNIVNAVNSITGLVATVNSTNVVLVRSNIYNLLLTIAYSGSQNIVASGPQGDNKSLAPNQFGPYGYDTTQTFTVSATDTTLAQVVDPASPKVIQVANALQFPNTQGYIMLGYGTQNQEGPIPYIGVSSFDTIQISPAYTVQNDWPIGTTVSLVYRNPVVLTQNATDYPFYVTGVVDGRVYAQDLINSIAATGMTINYTIQYPSDIGLGKAGTIYSEITSVWGP
jgi:hypothetical protein